MKKNKESSFDKKITRSQIEKEIISFFNQSISEKDSFEVKRIKKIAMSKNISLKDFKKLFCKYCLNPYNRKEKVRIKNGIKSTTCNKCNKTSRWKIKNEDLL